MQVPVPAAAAVDVVDSALDFADAAVVVVAAEDTAPSSYDEEDNIQDDASEEVVVEEDAVHHIQPCVDNAVASHTLAEVHQQVEDRDIQDGDGVDREDGEDASFVVVEALDDHNAMVDDHNSFEEALDDDEEDAVEDGNDEVVVVVVVDDDDALVAHLDS